MVKELGDMFAKSKNVGICGSFAKMRQQLRTRTILTRLAKPAARLARLAARLARLAARLARPAARLASMLAFVVPVSLGSAFISANAQAQEEHPAQVLVENAVGKVLGVLAENSELIKTDESLLVSTIDEHIVPHLDFSSMTKLTVSKHWRKASPAQREELVIEFRKFLLGSYTSALKAYGGQTIEFKPFRPEKKEGVAFVRSVFKESGTATPVLYKLRDKSGPWLVYDIEVGTLSLVVQYKSAFSREIEKNGIDGLISLLKEKNGS